MQRSHNAGLAEIVPNADGTPWYICSGGTLALYIAWFKEVLTKDNSSCREPSQGFTQWRTDGHMTSGPFARSAPMGIKY